MDYRLVNHHVEVLCKNSLLHSTGERYGRVYFLNPWLESHFDVFEDISKKLKFEQV
jgi:hypothetical protein